MNHIKYSAAIVIALSATILVGMRKELVKDKSIPKNILSEWVIKHNDAMRWVEEQRKNAGITNHAQPLIQYVEVKKKKRK